MLVEQIWTNNAWRNFNYLIACPESGDALAIDPLNFQQCADVAASRGWKISQILNTHEHHDHIEGNDPLKALTQAKLLAHKDAPIENVDVRLAGGEIVKVGSTVELLVIDTPGHTMSHICLLSSGSEPALFSGDTLFNAGVGNCHGGGHPEALFDTFDQCFSGLNDDTRIYPGHDYIINNLRFTLNREPGNTCAAKLLDEVMDQDLNQPLVTTMGLEKQINCFLRLGNSEIIENLYASVEGFPQSPQAKDVFLALRELRNHW